MQNDGEICRVRISSYEPRGLLTSDNESETGKGFDPSRDALISAQSPTMPGSHPGGRKGVMSVPDAY